MKRADARGTPKRRLRLAVIFFALISVTGVQYLATMEYCVYIFLMKCMTDQIMAVTASTLKSCAITPVYFISSMSPPLHPPQGGGVLQAVILPKHDF